jgi:hypothetical protein
MTPSVPYRGNPFESDPFAHLLLSQALHFFATMRTANAKGVTIPSQIRYVGYFEEYLREWHWKGKEKEFPWTGLPITLTGFKLRPKADFDVTPHLTIHIHTNDYMYLFGIGWWWM